MHNLRKLIRQLIKEEIYRNYSAQGVESNYYPVQPKYAEETTLIDHGHAAREIYLDNKKKIDRIKEVLLKKRISPEKKSGLFLDLVMPIIESYLIQKRQIFQHSDKKFKTVELIAKALEKILKIF